MTNAEVAHLAVQLDLKGNFTSSLGAAEKKLGTFGGALGHAGSQLKNIATIGLAALGVGIFTVTGFFEKGIAKASEFAFSIEKLQGLTNDSADSLSQLIAVTDNYGISADRLTKVVGFTEKTLGLLTTTAGAAATFAKQYGFSITDAAGKALPFNTILEKAADFYNSNADQATKAALAAKLFGRNYTDLVPILKLGSQGIRDAEQAAKDLGITLTQQNVSDLAKFRDATRSLGDAMTGLQLQIGLVLVPTITDLATTITTFVSSHRSDIVTFFKNALQAAKNVASVISGLASTVSTFWNAIPAPVRDLMTKGLIADRTVKFLFGFSPLESAGSSIFGQFFARGSSPANPMFVSGALGGVGGAGGGLPLVIPIAVIAAAIALAIQQANDFRAQRQAIQTAGAVPLTNTQALAIQLSQMTEDQRRSALAHGAATQFSNANTTYAAALESARATQSLTAAMVDLTHTQDAGDKSFREMHDAVVTNTAALAANTAKLAVGSLTERLKHPLAPHSYVNHLLTKADKIALSSESTAKKITELEAIKKKLDAGNHHQAYYLQRIIDAEKKSLAVKFTAVLTVRNGNTVRISATNSTNRVGGGGSSGSGTFIG